MRDGPLFALLLAALIVYGSGRVSDVDAEEPTPLRERVRHVLDEIPRSVFDDETGAETAIRLDELADAISRASRTDEEAAALLAIGQAESGFAEYVRAGCHYPDGIPRGAGHCDRGTSRSYWQMKETACRPGWVLPRGSKAAVYAFAVCARKRFLGGLKRCSGRHPSGDDIAGAMAAFRGGPEGLRCTWEGRTHDGARARSRLYRLRLGQLREVRGG